MNSLTNEIIKNIFYNVGITTQDQSFLENKLQKTISLTDNDEVEYVKSLYGTQLAATESKLLFLLCDISISDKPEIALLIKYNDTPTYILYSDMDKYEMYLFVENKFIVSPMLSNLVLATCLEQLKTAYFTWKPLEDDDLIDCLENFIEYIG